MKSFLPVPPIKNPLTEQACRQMASLYLQSTEPDPVRRKMVNDFFQGWLSSHPDLVRWEVLAMQDRIRSLIEHPECAG